jgi:4-diphosphocytidyl-2-C-methyl-D-erythritol kinase
MRVRAHAKINLSLRVLGRRADGYHELRTVFQSIALHDTLTIRRARGPFTFTCDNPACPASESNLVWKAAARLWTAAGRDDAPRDVRIDLVKRIPMEAGLGGGSSDAAAALLALARLWRVDEATTRIVGAQTGADVPYFFEGGTVLGLERGDLLFPLIDRPRVSVVLVLPDFGVSTREAFGWFDQHEPDVARDFKLRDRGPRRAAPRQTEAAPRQTEMINDLEAPVIAHHPEVGRIISALGRAGAVQAAMSGSGSAVFGLFSSRSAAARAARRLDGRGRRVLITETISRQAYRRLAPI